MPLRTQLTSLALGLIIVACNQESVPSQAEMTVRDSAGVTVVESAGPRWSGADAWQLTPDPVISIGVLEGESAYELFRVTGAVRLSDGRIVIGTAGTGELRFFDSTGVHLASVGGEGGGPGEFQALGTLMRGPLDTLVAYDMMARRLSVFDPQGGHVRDVSLAFSSQVTFPSVVGVFADGSLLAQVSQRQVFGPDAPELPLGPMRDSIVALQIAPDGERVDTIGRYAGSRMHVRTMEFGGNSMRVPAPLIFSPTTVLRPRGDAVVVGTTDRYELRIVDAEGRVQRIVRKLHRRIPVSQEDIDSAQARTRAAMERANMPAELMEQQLNRPAADSLPAYGTIQVDLAGNIWVQEYALSWKAPGWSVFDPDGAYLGDVTGMDDFRVTDIGVDYVLGVMTDELDVERVLLYGLVKP
jgi:hypothetical protein